MKKILLFLVTALAVCSMKATDAMASKHTDKTGITADFRLAKSRKGTSDTDLLAQQYLEKMKNQFRSNPDVFGMTKKELAGASLGGAFTTYVFHKNGRLISDDGLAYPVFYNGRMAAVLEMGYDQEALAYSYTFGRAYAQKLEQALCTGGFDHTKGLVGRIADKFFVTDGTHVEIILEQRANLLSEPDTISKGELASICGRLLQEARASYISIIKPSMAGYQKDITNQKGSFGENLVLKDVTAHKTRKQPSPKKDGGKKWASCAFTDVKPGQYAVGNTAYKIKEGKGRFQYAVSWAPMGNCIRVGLLSEDKRDMYYAACVSGKAEGVIDTSKIPAGKYYIAVYNETSGRLKLEALEGAIAYKFIK